MEPVDQLTGAGRGHFGDRYGSSWLAECLGQRETAHRPNVQGANILPMRRFSPFCVVEVGATPPAWSFYTPSPPLAYKSKLLMYQRVCHIHWAIVRIQELYMPEQKRADKKNITEWYHEECKDRKGRDM